jgi:multidrug transporter EmrE-like cation transporter
MQQIDDRLAGHPAGTLADRPSSKRGIAMSTVMLVLAATILGVIGQMMLKQGMTQMGPLSLTVSTAPQLVWRIATAPMVVAGLLVYGVGTFFWLITLSRIELSVAYPFVSLNHVIIFLLAWLVLREQISPMRAAGVLVICAGMLLVARS